MNFKTIDISIRFFCQINRMHRFDHENCNMKYITLRTLFRFQKFYSLDIKAVCVDHTKKNITYYRDSGGVEIVEG